MSQSTLAHCSSLQSIQQNKQQSYSLRPQKNKTIKKRSKKSCCSSKSCDSEETNPSSPQSEVDQIQISSPPKALKSVFWMVRDIIKKAKFGLDTYLACMKILQKMSFEGNQTLHKLVAASIVSIVGKVHQCRNLCYNDLINWSQRCFAKSDLVKTQAEILKGIGFQVPLINHFDSELQLALETKELEKYFS